MNILYILDTFPVLSQTFVLNEITGLIDLGHETQIISLNKPHEGKIHEKVAEYGLIDRITYLDSIGSNKDYMVKFIKENEVDIIYCHFGNIGEQFIFLKEILNVPIITYFHGYDFSLLPKEGIDYFSLFKKGDFFLTNSNYSKDKIIELGCPKDKIMVLGYGMDINKFKFKRRIVKDKLRLLTVGRLTEKKGIEYSIKAVAKSIKKYPNIVYNIIGEGELRVELENLIKELGVENNIFLLGSKTQEEVLKSMLESHIFILSSVTAKSGDTEGLGVVLLEAQATGMPVLATLHNGFLDSVNNGNSGFLVPERDVDALSDKLNYLIENPHIWEELGKEGRKHVVENYSNENVLNKLVRKFKELRK